MSSSSAGYVTVFVATLEALKEETLLKVTENGPLMIEVINLLIMSVSTCETRDFLVGLISGHTFCGLLNWDRRAKGFHLVVDPVDSAVGINRQVSFWHKILQLGRLPSTSTMA